MFNTLDGYIRLVKTNIIQVNPHEESLIRINRVDLGFWITVFLYKLEKITFMRYSL